MAVTATVLTGLLIWHASVVIYRDSFPSDAPPSAMALSSDPDCASGIARHHDAYTALWRSRESHDSDAPVPADLDRSLAALRAVCEREGEPAADAWRHLERWRYRAEAQTSQWRESLDDDARGALAYHPPGTSR